MEEELLVELLVSEISHAGAARVRDRGQTIALFVQAQERDGAGQNAVVCQGVQRTCWYCAAGMPTRARTGVPTTAADGAPTPRLEDVVWCP
jgi:hypothetical protein